MTLVAIDTPKKSHDASLQTDKLKTKGYGLTSSKFVNTRVWNDIT